MVGTSDLAMEEVVEPTAASIFFGWWHENREGEE